MSRKLYARSAFGVMIVLLGVGARMYVQTSSIFLAERAETNRSASASSSYDLDNRVRRVSHDEAGLSNEMSGTVENQCVPVDSSFLNGADIGCDCRLPHEHGFSCGFHKFTLALVEMKAASVAAWQRMVDRIDSIVNDTTLFIDITNS
jgi:hypothetical protein